MTTLFRAHDAQAPFRAAQQSRVSVNGVRIPPAAIAREVQHHAGASPLEAWREAARSLVVRELLLQEARRLGLVPAPLTDSRDRRETDDEALVRQVVEAEVSSPEADEATCRRYYESHIARFRSPDIFEAAHILLAARFDDATAMLAAKTKADEILSLIQAHPETFEDFAAAVSACSSGQQGGNLGQISSGQVTPEFEAALKQLEPGEVAREPVSTRYGYHIIRLDRRIDGTTLPFDLVRAEVAEFLEEKSARIATAQYLARLAARADLEGIELPTTFDLKVS